MKTVARRMDCQMKWWRIMPDHQIDVLCWAIYDGCIDGRATVKGRNRMRTTVMGNSIDGKDHTIARGHAKFANYSGIERKWSVIENICG